MAKENILIEMVIKQLNLEFILKGISFSEDQWKNLKDN